MAAPIWLLLTVSLITTLILFTASAWPQPNEAFELNQVRAGKLPAAGDGELDSGHQAVIVIHRLVAKSTKLTCDTEPKICRSSTKDSRDRCCEKKCVDLNTDSLNCGKCENKCKVDEACCKGKCVDLTMDRKNCGSCGNKCRRGPNCSYGMCSYA